MILTIALTQFVFVSLGILALHVLLKSAGFAANVADSFPVFPVWLAEHSFWFFVVPLVWMACAGLLLHDGREGLREGLVRWTGGLVATAVALTFFAACFSLF